MNKFSGVVKDLQMASDFAVRNQSVPYVGIIIHHTGIPKEIDEPKLNQFFQSMVNWLSLKDENYLSAHFVIGRMGEVTQLLDPNTQVAYHAGTSSYYHPWKRKVVENWNQYSVGIELIGDGNIMSYSNAQYESLAYLCRDILKAYPTIDPRCITGHENISPGRKFDPGLNFNWTKLFKLIYRE